MKHECHKCKYNNSKNPICIECVKEDQDETYSYKYNKYIIDGYEPKEEEKPEQVKCTNLPEDNEDYLRKLLYTIFDLEPNELLCLKAIMNNKDLTTFAKEMEALSVKNNQFSRFRAFQTRKAILKKHPELNIALITQGQRKELKK